MSTSLRILVVDDRLDSVSTLVDHLRALRHQVDTAEGSMEALSLIARKASSGSGYHLLISDLNMPVLDGMGLARELRRRHENLGIAFITGYHTAGAKIRQEATDIGLLGVLGKPTSPEEITALLAKVRTSGSERLKSNDGDGGTAFFGTARISRTTASLVSPEEGALARARVDQRDQAEPLDFDELLGKSAETIPPAPAPTESGSAQRRVRTPDPSAFYNDHGVLGGTSSFYKRPKSDPFLPSGKPLDPRVAAPPPGTARDPVTGNYRRTPSGIYQDPGTQTTTSRHRREAPRPPGTSGGPPASFTPLGQEALPAPGGITSGFRRSLTGSTTPPATQRTSTNQLPVAQPTCTVACAHCHGQFQVLIKPTAYTVLCVHCGQLNRIDPL